MINKYLVSRKDSHKKINVNWRPTEDEILFNDLKKEIFALKVVVASLAALLTAGVAIFIF